MHSVKDLTVQVHTPDGESNSATVPANYKTAQFLKEIVRAFNLSATANWIVHDVDIDRTLEKDKSLEENGVREGHHLHFRERQNGPDPEPEPPPSATGKRKAKIGPQEPVCAWLVCIESPSLEEIGRDYKIRSGNNTIGRSPDMNICMSGDEAVSHNRHAVITFEPQTNSFHIRSGEGRSPAYVNKQAVLETIKLRPYDEIRLGTTKVLFVPFCGDNFIWVKDAS
jgi:hypothetical protein